MKVGGREAKNRAMEGWDVDLGLYFVTLSSW